MLNRLTICFQRYSKQITNDAIPDIFINQLVQIIYCFTFAMLAVSNNLRITLLPDQSLFLSRSVSGKYNQLPLQPVKPVKWQSSNY